MAVALFFMLLTSIAALGQGDREKECPPWFRWVNTSDSSGYCVCVKEVPECILCDQINQVSWLKEGSCAFHESEGNTTRAYWCYFLFKRNIHYLPLPANVSELNNVVCGNLSREVKGPLCGRCTNGTGPSVYSVGSKCVHCSPVNVLYYILLQYFPSTLIFLVVVIFRPSITSAPMANYVLYCNATTLYFRFVLWAYIKLDNVIGKATLTLSAIWSFDALYFVSPPVCLSQHMEEFYLPFLEFLATIYPFILLMLIYGVMKLHIHNFKPVVILWKPFSQVYVHFYRAWDPRSSMLQAFSSIFFLSYAKICYLIWDGFLYTTDMNSNGQMLLYIDPNVPYFSAKHVLLMVFSLAVAVFVFLPPLLILVVYPTSLYRKISHWISQKWRLRIKTYVEIFHSSFKDGTNGTRDYRSLSGWIFLLLGFFPQFLIAIFALATPDKQWSIFLFSYPVAILYGASAILSTFLQPYKDKLSNAITNGLLVISSLIFATSAGVFDTGGKNEMVEIMMITLLLTPHCVLWGYVVWKATKSFCRCSLKDTVGERNSELQVSAQRSNCGVADHSRWSIEF